MTRLARGVLVAFEGIDGSGKSTQAALLADYLRGLGIEVLTTKEPTAGPWGQKLRDSKRAGRMAAGEELTYFLEDRNEHVTKEIQPALERGIVVIIDRYYYSTVAYQGARGMDPRELLQRNRVFAPIPDLMVLVDVDPRVGVERIHGRGLGQDLFENLDDLAKARAIFLQLDDAHIMKVDGALSVAAIHEAVRARFLAGAVGRLVRDACPDAYLVR